MLSLSSLRNKFSSLLSVFIYNSGIYIFKLLLEMKPLDISYSLLRPISFLSFCMLSQYTEYLLYILLYYIRQLMFKEHQNIVKSIGETYKRLISLQFQFVIIWVKCKPNCGKIVHQFQYYFQILLVSHNFYSSRRKTM